MNNEGKTILGISAFYHDSAACLVRNGEIISAAQEERFSRKKHDDSFPVHAIEYCLNSDRLAAKDLDYIAFYEKPFLKFERLLETYLAFAPKGFGSFVKAMPVWLKQKLWIKNIIQDKLGFNGKILFPEHHESHAASAFYPSQFQDAAFLTIDGVGEWATASYGIAHGNKIEMLAEIKFPHSLGLLYSAFTYYTGFKVNSDEYKVMGLAPYGVPKYKNLILRELIEVCPDGSFQLNMKYFNYCTGLTMTNEHFNELFGGPPRKPEATLSQKEMDLAASIQEVTNEIMLRMAKHVRRATGQRNLCLAGGVALNCVSNAKILENRLFDHIWIQPAAGDAGGALGAALLTWYQYLQNPRYADGKNDSQKGSYLGPAFSNRAIREFLIKKRVQYQEVKEEELIKKVAALIADGKVIGWFEGRMEFGPRALGARSILGDARRPDMQKRMNLKIKFRESFRPFAPSVLAEKAQDYFEIPELSPYMLLIAQVKEKRHKHLDQDAKEAKGLKKLDAIRSEIPAVTHVDYSARIQSVEKNVNPLYHKLISEFDKNNNCPVIINTSFNVRDEPIVCSPEDAYQCFMMTQIDCLVMGNFILEKKSGQTTKSPVW